MNKLIIGNSKVALEFAMLSGVDRIDEFFSSKDYDVIFLLHEDDSKNIRDALAIHKQTPECKIYAMLVDSDLGEKIKYQVYNFDYFIPSKLVADKFVEAIKDAYSTDLQFKKTPFSWKIDPWIRNAILWILFITVMSTFFFSYYFNYSVFDALYFTLVQVVTGGDVSLMSAPKTVKIVAMLVMICGFFGIALTISLISDYLLSKKHQSTWGIKRYKGENHVIVIGGGSVGYRIIQKLLSMKEKIVLIDTSITGPFMKAIKQLKIPFIIGDGRHTQTLVDAGLSDAKAVIAATSNDLINLEIGLDTKVLDPDLRVVLRIFDTELSNNLKETGLIKYSFSMSHTAAEYLQNLDK